MLNSWNALKTKKKKSNIPLLSSSFSTAHPCFSHHRACAYKLLFSSQSCHEIILPMTMVKPTGIKIQSERAMIEPFHFLKASWIDETKPFFSIPSTSAQMTFYAVKRELQQKPFIASASLPHFCMVVQWVLKTAVLTFFAALHQGRCNSYIHTYIIIYQINQLCFHMQISCSHI